MTKRIVNQYVPDYVVLPGEVLSEELALRQMTQKELTDRVGISTKHLNEVVKGAAAITPDLAIKFERALGMPAQYWLNLETHYQETLARIKESELLNRDINWLKQVPVKAMIQLGWIQKLPTASEQLDAVLKYFGIASVGQWQAMWSKLNVAYRQHAKGNNTPEAISAWLRQGELQAKRIVCQPFDKKTFKQALTEIRAMTLASPEVFVPRLVERCASAGVAVVFVPSLPAMAVSGATRWLSHDKAMIQLSLRYKTNDHLWFTFFHEAAHISLHGKKALFLEGSNGLDAEKEVEANIFAEQILLPSKDLDAFIKEKNFSKTRIQQFANEQGIAAGIVVGNLQHKKLINHSYLNELKVSYSWTST